MNKVVSLAEHWTKSSHLPHQPLNHAQAALAAGREKPLRLLCQKNQDRTRFHQGHSGFAINNGRNSIVGAYLEEVRVELFGLRDVYRVHRVLETHLFQCNGDLSAIRSRPGIKIYHFAAPCQPGLFNGWPISLMYALYILERCRFQHYCNWRFSYRHSSKLSKYFSIAPLHALTALR